LSTSSSQLSMFSSICINIYSRITQIIQSSYVETTTTNTQGWANHVTQHILHIYQHPTYLAYHNLCLTSTKTTTNTCSRNHNIWSCTYYYQVILNNIPFSHDQHHSNFFGNNASWKVSFPYYPLTYKQQLYPLVKALGKSTLAKLMTNRVVERNPFTLT